MIVIGHWIAQKYYYFSSVFNNDNYKITNLVKNFLVSFPSLKFFIPGYFHAILDNVLKIEKRETSFQYIPTIFIQEIFSLYDKDDLFSDLKSQLEPRSFTERDNLTVSCDDQTIRHQIRFQAHFECCHLKCASNCYNNLTPNFLWRSGVRDITSALIDKLKMKKS